MGIGGSSGALKALKNKFFLGGWGLLLQLFCAFQAPMERFLTHILVSNCPSHAAYAPLHSPSSPVLAFGREGSESGFIPLLPSANSPHEPELSKVGKKS